MKIQDHIIPVFLKSLTGNSFARSIKLKVNVFSILHFYAETSGNDNKTIYPQNKTGFYRLQKGLFQLEFGIYW
jgi:hypothetical protein